MPPNIERLWLNVDDATRVEAWLVKPQRPTVGPNPAVIFFHGNAETIDDSVGHAEIYTKLGYAVLLPEYRGYGRSGGSPSQAAIRSDMGRFYDLLHARSDIDPSRIIYHGRSLGGGVACDLARSRPPAGMILESTFTSVASFCWGFGVPPFLCRNPFHSDDVVQALDRPLLIVHGAEDNIVPVSHGRTLRDLARHGTYLEMAGRHNDFPQDWFRYEREIGAFVADVPARAPSTHP